MREPNTILTIDDDGGNIFGLKAVLKLKGFAVLSASSTKEGMELLPSSNGVEIVLLDMMLPDMDGSETLEIRRAGAGLKNATVFSVTVQAMTRDREKCLQASANEYVPRPIDADLLVDLLNRHN